MLIRERMLIILYKSQKFRNMAFLCHNCKDREQEIARWKQIQPKAKASLSGQFICG